MITKVTGKNQVTIPAKVAKQFDIRSGTRIHWFVGDEGQLCIQIVPDRATLARQIQGMGKALLKKGDDPLRELLEERSREL